MISICLLLFLAACTGTPTGEVMPVEPIKVGFMSALSGDAATWGESTLDGAQLAIEEINRKGGINGRPLELVVQDDKCDAATGVTVYHELVQKGVNTIMGQACSSVILAIAPLAEEDEVLLLGTGTTNPTISDAGEFTFRLWVSDAYEGSETAKFALSEGVTRIAMITLQNDYGVGLRDAFSDEFVADHGQIVASEQYPPETRDFRSMLTKLLAKKPEALFIAANPGELPTLLNQLRILNQEIPVYLNGPAFEPQLEVIGSDGEGVKYTRSTSKDRSTFITTFTQRYGEEPGLVSSRGYDGIAVLAKAYDECGNEETSCLRDRLYEIKNMDGASGVITFDRKGDRVGETFERVEIVNGEPIVR